MQSRRSFLQGTGLGLLTFSLAGAQVLLTPRQARARGADFLILSDTEVAILEVLGNVLVPGAAEAGVAHFIDQQLGAEPNDCLLMARYMNIEPPYAAFYQAGIKAIDELSRQSQEKSLTKLSETEAIEVVRSFATSNFLDYFLLRSDAVDVVYGTVEGFEKLKIPYRPHILPPSNW